MNKPLYLLFLILLFPAFCISANLILLEDTNKPALKSHKLSIGGSFGGCLPTEIYGSTLPSWGSNTGGGFYADPGFHFDANIKYRISQQWGIFFQVEGNWNNVDKKYYGDWGMYYGNSEPSGTGGYYLGVYSIGAYSSVNFENGDELECWLTGDFMSVEESPMNITFYSSGPFGSGWSQQTYTGGIILGGGGSLGVRFKFPIAKRAFITFNISYDQLFTCYYYVNLNSLVPIGLLSGGVGVEFKL